MSVLNEIKEIIANQVKIDISKISEKTTFRDLNADSLDVVEVFMAIESKYNILLSDDVENLKNVGELAKFVERKLG